MAAAYNPPPVGARRRANGKTARCSGAVLRPPGAGRPARGKRVGARGMQACRQACRRAGVRQSTDAVHRAQPPKAPHLELGLRLQPLRKGNGVLLHAAVLRVHALHHVEARGGVGGLSAWVNGTESGPGRPTAGPAARCVLRQGQQALGGSSSGQAQVQAQAHLFREVDAAAHVPPLHPRLGRVEHLRPARARRRCQQQRTAHGRGAALLRPAPAAPQPQPAAPSWQHPPRGGAPGPPGGRSLRSHTPGQAPAVVDGSTLGHIE